MLFSLTNEQRSCLGLAPVEQSWEVMQLSEQIYLYFDGDILRKKITVTPKRYHEQELDQETGEGRTLLLSRTGKGKAKKLNYSGLQSCKPLGVYFLWDKEILVGNYTTQTTWYSSYGDGKSYDTLEQLKAWLDWWVEDSTAADLQDMQQFRHAQRQHVKVREGDFFAFRIGRREYGFGRVLLDVRELKKQRSAGKLEEKHYGLLNLPAQPLVVKVYHRICGSAAANLAELASLAAFPAQPIMDNVFYYGEYQIIGNRPLAGAELEFPISYGWSVNAQDQDVAYLQYGMIYRVAKGELVCGQPAELRQVLERRDFRCESVGYALHVLRDIEGMRRCIQGEGAQETAALGAIASADLRSPVNFREKELIFRFFGLDASLDYQGNCLIAVH